jgi:hypothetical protein
MLIDVARLLRRLIASLNLLLRGDTGTSCGFTIRYMEIILGLLFLHLRRSKLSVGLIRILLSLVVLLWREC